MGVRDALGVHFSEILWSALKGNTSENGLNGLLVSPNLDFQVTPQPM